MRDHKRQAQELAMALIGALAARPRRRRAKAAKLHWTQRPENRERARRNVLAAQRARRRQ